MPYQLKGGVIAPKTLTCKTCPWAPDCLFDRKDRGGFKDLDGGTPEYIGYRLICDRVEQNGAKEDTTTCFNFIDSGLQERMLAGRELRERGRDGELVRIVAMREGLPGWTGRTTVKRRVSCGVNSRGEIVRPQIEIRDMLKKAGHKICTDDNAAALPVFREFEYDEPVPDYQQVQRKVSGYQQGLLVDELKHEAEKDEAEEAIWQQAMERQKAAAKV